MKFKEPLVSVVMTVYNAADFVMDAVESIQNQTYQNWELIVVNDGSSDKTKEILEKIAKTDKRIKVINYVKNRGASYASNLGLSHAKGQFIARMDADDISAPDRLERQVEFLQDHPKVIIVGGQCELIDRDGNSIGMKNFPTSHREIYDALYQYNPIQHPSLMINRKLLGKENITYHTKVLLAHDLEILFKLAQYGRLANLSETVLLYRIHGDSLSLRNPKETFRHTLAVRKMAKQEYGYRPSVKGIVVHNLQKMVMMILPSVVVYPLFRLLRMGRVKQSVQIKWAYVTAAITGILSR